MSLRPKLREMASDRKKNALESQARDRMLDELVQKFQFLFPNRSYSSRSIPDWIADCAHWLSRG